MTGILATFFLSLDTGGNKSQPFPLTDVRQTSFKIPKFMALLYNSELIYSSGNWFYFIHLLTDHGMMVKVYKIRESRL